MEESIKDYQIDRANTNLTKPRPNIKYLPINRPTTLSKQDSKNASIERIKDVDVPSHLMDIINDIKKLKVDPTHQERAHESVIERFFEYLGYERFNDIRYRVGRVDISIRVQGSPIIVIEVKKYWNLNAMRDLDVTKQAYNYALVNGSRFVIVSNGDYYAVFDRDNGRKYEDNLKGQFYLTSLCKDDLKLIDFLKKKNLKSIN